MYSRRTGLIVVVAAVVVIIFAAAHAQNAMRSQPTAVAVVNWEKIYTELKEKQAVEADIQSKIDKFNEQQEKRKKNIEELRADIDLYAPDNPTFEKKQEEVDKKVVEYLTWKDYTQRKLNDERIIQIENLYRSITDAVGLVAAENGYDLVLSREGEPSFKDANLQQVLNLIALRKVLWADESVDLTDQVIQRMNNEYENIR